MIDGPRAEVIAERLEAIRQRINAAGGTDVEVLAVTKGQPASVVTMALAAGCDRLGESYAAELTAKADDVPEARWCFVGQLQTNKVRVVSPRVELICSVDRPSLVTEIARRSPASPVMLQVDLRPDSERDPADARGGVALSDLPALVDLAAGADLDVVGLMGVAPIGDTTVAGAAFGRLRRAVDRHGLTQCSMGMTHDYEVAVAEGSTMVRIGTGLFGDRPRGPR